jgi:hypothetical protein
VLIEQKFLFGRLLAIASSLRVTTLPLGYGGRLGVVLALQRAQFA